MHKNNKHQNKYNIPKLIEAQPELKTFVFENNFGTQTIDFANPEAVKLLNKALLKTYYSIDYWEFPDINLCPPIPGRVNYIHHLAELIKPYKFKDSIKVLDVGTGATCIYPLLGNSVYSWNFVATEIDSIALESSKIIVEKNNLNKVIELRLQPHKSHILKDIIREKDTFTLSMCNPPFYKNEQDAIQSNLRKLVGLGKKNTKHNRNFSGTANELWYEGGEKAFLHSYLYESSLFKTTCFWFTSLVSNKDLVKSMQKSLKKLGATKVRVINMQLGNKISRIVAWTFVSEDEQKDWLT